MVTLGDMLLPLTKELSSHVFTIHPSVYLAKKHIKLVGILTCERCNSSWEPKAGSTGLPKFCPICKSKYWATKRKAPF